MMRSIRPPRRPREVNLTGAAATALAAVGRARFPPVDQLLIKVLQSEAAYLIEPVPRVFPDSLRADEAGRLSAARARVWDVG
jgi:hypothetical protein